MAERTGYLCLGLREVLRQTLAFFCERKDTSSDSERSGIKSLKSCEAISVGNGKAADLEKCNKMSTLKCHFKYPKRNRLLEKVGQIWAFNGDYLLWRIDSDGLTDRIWQSILNTSENQADSWNRRLSSGSWALWLGFTRRATPEARVPKPVHAGLLQTRGSV